MLGATLEDLGEKDPSGAQIFPREKGRHLEQMDSAQMVRLLMPRGWRGHIREHNVWLVPAKGIHQHLRRIIIDENP